MKPWSLWLIIYILASDCIVSYVLTPLPSLIVLTDTTIYFRSKIVFKTAGVLLDEMRDKGMAALKYKVIILDEVHERSVESDLVLVCVKQLMLKNKDLRCITLTLMTHFHY